MPILYIHLTLLVLSDHINQIGFNFFKSKYRRQRFANRPDRNNLWEFMKMTLLSNPLNKCFTKSYPIYIFNKFF